MEAIRYTDSVFKMFDINNDKPLTFKQFMFATSAQHFDTPTQKLGWLFDNVYDRVRLLYLLLHSTHKSR